MERRGFITLRRCRRRMAAHVSLTLMAPDGVDVSRTSTQPIAGAHAQLVSTSQHHESQLRGLRHRFGPTVCIELGEYRSDVKLCGVERNTQPTGNGFV